MDKNEFKAKFKKLLEENNCSEIIFPDTEDGGIIITTFTSTKKKKEIETLVDSQEFKSWIRVSFVEIEDVPNLIKSNHYYRLNYGKIN
jgi:hypothetical protein